MAARKPVSSKPAARDSTADVDRLLADLEHPGKPEIEAVRALILGADKRIRESVKWNAPSYCLADHFATFKLRPPGSVQVVFHTGAKVRPDARAIVIDDPAGLLKWAAKDRCVATFKDMQDVKARGNAFVAIVRQWIEQTADLIA